MLRVDVRIGPIINWLMPR